MVFLIIGLGSMGKRRIRNLLANGEKDIIGFDLSEERRKEAEEKHGIKTIGDLSTLSSDQYDALIISTPPNKHGDYIRKALEEKKHFFVEHTTSDDAYDEAIAMPADGIVRAPSCTYRFFEPIKRMKALLESGRIGKLLAYDYHLGQYLPDWHPWEDYRTVYFSKKETSAIREMMPFEQTWLTWLVGAPVRDVRGHITKISDLDMDADDYLSASLVYANGVRASLLIDVLSRKTTRSLQLIGSNGNMEWDWIGGTLRVYDATTKQEEVMDTKGGKAEEGYLNVEECYIEEIGTFLKAVRGEAKWPYTFEEDRGNLRALYELEKSGKTKA